MNWYSMGCSMELAGKGLTSLVITLSPQSNSFTTFRFPGKNEDTPIYVYTYTLKYKVNCKVRASY